MSRFQKILVAVDFSETSDDVLSTAAELSRTYHAPLHLLHVVPNTIPSAYALEPVGFDLGAYLRQSLDEARAQLLALVVPYAVAPAMLTTSVLAGPPAPEIVRYAADHDVDLIVLGAHGHGFLDRLLIGSVAERVSRHAPCAVLMVPHRMVRSNATEAATTGPGLRVAMGAGPTATATA